MSWANVLRAAWIALFATAVALMVAKYNLFGLESSSGERADDVAQRLGIVSYHHTDDGNARPGQDRVRVIHIDDEGLKSLKPYWGGWPPGYENLGVMIEDVARAPRIQPARAVFVDLEITGENLSPQSEAEFESLIAALRSLTRAEPRTTPGWGADGCRHDALTTLACMVEWNGVPVILASGERLASGSAAKGSPQDRLAQVALLSPTLVDSRNYPLVTVIPPSEPREALQTDGYNLYPAAAMYAVDCLVRAKGTGDDVCGVPAIEIARKAAAALRKNPYARPAMPDWGDVSETWSQPEAVIWSSDASPRQKALWAQTSTGNQPTCVARPSLLDRIRLKAPAQGDQQACTYTLSLGYDRIVAGLGLSRDRDYPDLLGDKLILIGVQFRSSDWTPTPLHGSLPGVQYHAMALDNLLEFGRNYRRNEGTGLGRGDLFASILTFLMLFAVNLASIKKRRMKGASGVLRPLTALAWYGGLAVILVVGLTAYIWGTAFLWRSVMVNWIGVLTTVLAAVWFTAKNDISGDVANWMGRSRAGNAIVKAVAAFNTSLRSVAPSPPEDKP